MKSKVLILAVLLVRTGFSQVADLRDTTNQYDYVIITIPEFVETCLPFKDHKENVRGMKTIIADTATIYAQFDSSETREDRIRDFISYAGTFWKEPQPKYFLLVGNLDMIPNHLITTIIQTVNTDFLFSQSIYDDDTLSVEFYIGRVPANDDAEINNYFNKVINYESDNNLYTWNNNSLFFTEYDSAGRFGLQNSAISLSNHLPDFIDSFFLFEYDTSSAVALYDSLLYLINSVGMSSIWFFRLGMNIDSALGYTNFFTVDDVELLTNIDKPFVGFFMLEESFSYDSIVSFSNKFLLSEGGSIGSIGPVGVAFWPTIFNQFLRFALKLYQIDNISLGKVMDPEENVTINTQIMNLWGDPSLKLKYDTTTDVEPVQTIPAEYVLAQNYPNPFNPETTINFTLQKEGYVEIKVFDILGKEKKVLTNSYYPAGTHSIDFNAGDLGSGIYFYTMKSGEFLQTRKMVLVK
jgi:hypothetical protein